MEWMMGMMNPESLGPAPDDQDATVGLDGETLDFSGFERILRLPHFQLGGNFSLDAGLQIGENSLMTIYEKSECISANRFQFRLAVFCSELSYIQTVYFWRFCMSHAGLPGDSSCKFCIMCNTSLTFFLYYNNQQ
jgi:hypothetical protein